eukprot:363351-Chlamydomonas_euryale.AAC.8
MRWRACMLQCTHSGCVHVGMDACRAACVACTPTPSRVAMPAPQACSDTYMWHGSWPQMHACMHVHCHATICAAAPSKSRYHVCTRMRRQRSVLIPLWHTYMQTQNGRRAVRVNTPQMATMPRGPVTHAP